MSVMTPDAFLHGPATVLTARLQRHIASMPLNRAASMLVKCTRGERVDAVMLFDVEREVAKSADDVTLDLFEEGEVIRDGKRVRR